VSFHDERMERDCSRIDRFGNIPQRFARQTKASDADAIEAVADREDELRW
jgi:hypothetical protein